MVFGVAALLPPVLTWLTSVNKLVKEPYLDEYFHVRQAQQYCEGHWNVWDPKITTPPGLYFLSILFRPILGCDIRHLRAINALCLVALLLVLRATYQVRRESNRQNGFISGLLASHSSLNAVLFPPLFFFSGLYYTDIASTLSWAVFYCHFLQTIRTRRRTLVQGLVQVLLGSISLTFRQTNIFWVAVSPVAIVLIIELDRGHRVVKESMYRRAEGFGDTTLSVAKTSWKMGVVYDPPIRDAFLEDFFRTIISIAACALRALTQPHRIFEIGQALAPYLTLLGIFGGFILWNGGVVLGDKSNHIATINLPQMLYIWPFLAFFSWPLLLPHFLLLPLMVVSRIGQFANLEALLIFRRHYFLPRVWVLAGFLALACLTVYFNTVVHPFLLADNRHYHFYVFKRLLRPWWVRYAVTPIYVITAWACIETRGEPPAQGATAVHGGNDARPDTLKRQASDTTTDPLKYNAASDAAKSSSRIPDGKSTAMVSFVLISLATTALTLCSAPLVEPRYCIIPFIMWRIHLPMYAVEEHVDKKVARTPSTKAILDNYDYRVVLETFWYLFINVVTGLIFLNWTFSWPSEPENLQRFMW